MKGAAFQPDERLRRLLADGARLGDGMAKAIAFASRDPEAHIYPDRHWERIFIGGYKFERDGARLLDARTLFHYTAIVVTPAMEAKMVGVGSQYLATYKDASGAYLDGGQDYRLRLPAGIPAKDFWSVTVYDAETRSLLQNGQPKPSLSTYDKPDANADGSVDVFFGPRAPKGREKNWVKTLPGKGWFPYLRLYGPLEPFFEQTWRPDDIVKAQGVRGSSVSVSGVGVGRAGWGTGRAARVSASPPGGGDCLAVPARYGCCSRPPARASRTRAADRRRDVRPPVVTPLIRATTDPADWCPGIVSRHISPGRGIPTGGVAPPSQTPSLLGRRALPFGRRAPGPMPRITMPGHLLPAPWRPGPWPGRQMPAAGPSSTDWCRCEFPTCSPSRR